VGSLLHAGKTNVSDRYGAHKYNDNHN